jgi:hypothetical protein
MMIAGTSGTTLVSADSASANGFDLKVCKLERLLRAEQHRRVVFNHQNPDRI